MTSSAAATDPLLDIRGLTIGFTDVDRTEVTLLRGVDIQVRRGEIVALVGESGCGKTLTTRAVLGLLQSPPLEVTAGTIRFDGVDLLGLGADAIHALRGRAMTLVPQHPLSSLNPVFTVGEQFFDLLSFQGRASIGPLGYLRPRLDRTARDRNRAATIAALKSVSLPDPEGVIDRYPSELSGGMCQRVLIAMALLSTPKLIIADEPGTALDVTIEAQINRLLLAKVREQRTAMLYITHDLGIARELSDRVFVMYAGRVVETGATAQVFARPRHPYTRGLIDSVPRLSAAPIKGIRGVLPDPKTLGEGCAFRFRCDFAVPACSAATPPLAAVAPAQAAACPRSAEIAL
ncbi:MAG: ABC transporter ATP-binding protein [Alphaproteobacteria bacterium]|nr:ABC transporter ATP-binding protein [Alphaproteobacteria bacterium]